MSSNIKLLRICQYFSIHFKFKGGTTDVQGVSCAKGEIHLKGSQIDRGLSYCNITRRLELNLQQGLHNRSRIGFTHSVLTNRNKQAPDNRATQEAGSNLFKWAYKDSGSILNLEPAMTWMGI